MRGYIIELYNYIIESVVAGKNNSPVDTVKVLIYLEHTTLKQLKQIAKLKRDLLKNHLLVRGCVVRISFVNYWKLVI